MQRTVGCGIVRRGLQICEALRRLCRYHVVTSIEWSLKRLPAEVLDRSYRWFALPVLKHNLFSCTLRNRRADRVDPPALSEPSMRAQLGRPRSGCHLAICVRLREIECKRRSRFRMAYGPHLRSLAGP